MQSRQFDLVAAFGDSFCRRRPKKVRDSETPKVQEMNCYGKPKAWKEGERDVFAMWYDGDKWHVAVRGSKGTKVHYHGRITTSAGQVTDILLIELERKAKRKSADFFVIMPNRRGFDFSFANTGADRWLHVQSERSESAS